MALLALGAVSPLLFPAAQAGMASFPSLVRQFLLPSAALIFLLLFLLKVARQNELFRLSGNGMIAGVIATLALEIFRETGFRIGWMPGDLPRLMGVIMLNQFATGPDIYSDLAGWGYHAWNGAMFGLLFSLLLGQVKMWQGVLFGILIGTGFMVSPVVKSLGIGLFGTGFKDGYQFLITVTLAHIAFGSSLAFLLYRWNAGITNIWQRYRNGKEKI